MAHTQKSAADRALEIVVSQGGGYAINKWNETKIRPAREANEKAATPPAGDSGAPPDRRKK